MHGYFASAYPWFGPGFGLFGGLGAVLLALGALGFGVAAFSRGRRRDSGAALDLAAERFARGEIDEEEFRKIKTALSK